VAQARSRKRRPAGPRKQAQPAPAPAARPAKDARRAPRHGSPPAAGRARSSPAAPIYGERPRAPWHPLPLSELLILVGGIGAALGLSKLGHGLSSGGPALVAGVGAVALGTFEVALREHRSGYRSHTTMLALLPVLVLDTAAVAVGLAVFTTLPRLFGVGLLVLDVPLFALLFKLLRARFLDARHRRVLEEG